MFPLSYIRIFSAVWGNDKFALKLIIMATINERLTSGNYFEFRPSFLPLSSNYLQLSNFSVLFSYQVLRPATRRKLRIFGDDYQKFLSEHLQTLPSFLGGDCSCPKCSKSVGKEKTVVGPSIVYEAENVSPHSASASVSAYCSDDFEFIKCDKVLKSIAIGLLLVLLYILLTIRFHNLEGIQLYTSGW